MSAAASTTTGVVDNAPLPDDASLNHYSLRGLTRALDRHPGELALVAAFSRGGTRAVALSCGVLQELRDTPEVLNSKRARMLDAVGVISSDSGGSFTSADYGPYGDRIFVDFEQRFLRRNVEGPLIRGLLDPLRWFSRHGRSVAKDYLKSLGVSAPRRIAMLSVNASNGSNLGIDDSALQPSIDQNHDRRGDQHPTESLQLRHAAADAEQFEALEP